MNTKISKKSEFFGIKQDTINAISEIIYSNTKVKEIIIFGSRAKGNYKKGSDIDLAIIADDLSLSELLEIKSKINDLPIPYQIDVVDFNKLENKDLIEHIKRVGKKVEKVE